LRQFIELLEFEPFFVQPMDQSLFLLELFQRADFAVGFDQGLPPTRHFLRHSGLLLLQLSAPCPQQQFVAVDVEQSVDVHLAGLRTIAQPDANLSHFFGQFLLVSLQHLLRLIRFGQFLTPLVAIGATQLEHRFEAEAKA
jgi:hypothetical protein